MTQVETISPDVPSAPLMPWVPLTPLRALMAAVIGIAMLNLLAALIGMITAGFSFGEWLYLPVRLFTENRSPPPKPVTWTLGEQVVLGALVAGIMLCLAVVPRLFRSVEVMGRRMFPEPEHLFR